MSISSRRIQPARLPSPLVGTAVDDRDPASRNPVVLYDGVCGLCQRTVQFLIAHDPGAIFRFATLQGGFASRVLSRHGFAQQPDRDPDSLADRRADSLVLIEAPGSRSETLRFRSDAVIAIASRLAAPWRWGIALRALPRPIRDLAYDLVARARYRWFGRLDACPIPDPRLRDRFID